MPTSAAICLISSSDRPPSAREEPVCCSSIARLRRAVVCLRLYISLLLSSAMISPPVDQVHIRDFSTERRPVGYVLNLPLPRVRMVLPEAGAMWECGQSG